MIHPNCTPIQKLVFKMVRKFQQHEIDNTEITIKELETIIENEETLSDLEFFGYLSDNSLYSRVLDYRDHLLDELDEMIPPIPLKAIYNDIITF